MADGALHSNLAYAEPAEVLPVAPGRSAWVPRVVSRGGARLSTRAKWALEAEAKGWNLVATVVRKHGVDAIYRHSACGHKQAGSSNAMRNGTVLCRGCENPYNRWADEAKVHGWTLLEGIGDGQGRYRHRCGHNAVQSAQRMKAGLVFCERCERHKDRSVEHRWGVEAERVGWTLIRRVGAKHGLYRHTCGRERKAQAVHIRNGKVACACRKTREERWTEEASARGWTLVEVLDAQSGRYAHNCGVVRILQAGNLRRGWVVCKGCFKR